MSVRYPDNRPRRLYLHKATGELYEVLGFITEPAAILRPIVGGQDQCVVCSSEEAKHYAALSAEGGSD